MSLKFRKQLYVLQRRAFRLLSRATIDENGGTFRLSNQQAGCQVITRSLCTKPHSQSTETSASTIKYDQHTVSSVDQTEVDKFSRIAKSWWDVMGKFRALHNMNELRVPLIRDAMMEKVDSDSMACREPRPLKGINILDVGCGGGILSEPLARLGAHVTGVDASAENIAMAEWHAKLDKHLMGYLDYKCCAVEDLATGEGNSYDAVVASEIIEHVANQEHFIASCCQLVKPGGSVFFTTLNKTWLSYVLGIVAAERILRIVPAGAHDWNKFLPPSTLQSWLAENDFRTVLIHGMALNPLTQRWTWTRDTSISYALHAIKSESTS